MAVETDATRLLGIKNPILLAGMGRVSGAKLAAAVSNAGGMSTQATSSLSRGCLCRRSVPKET